MILKRLYELAEREHLLEDPAFEEQPIPFVVQVGPAGEYLGILDTRGIVEIPTRRNNAPPKTRRDKGKVLSVPKAHGNTANPGFARFFADTLPRVLPISDEAKSVKSRNTFWEQVWRAAQKSGDPALQALVVFGQTAATDGGTAQKIRAKVEELKPGPGDRCTLAWHGHGGKTIVESDAVRGWYRQFFAALTGKQQQAGAQGLCQITGEMGPLPNTHTTKISGVGGLAVGVSVVSNDKAAFESYGLAKAVNSGIGARAAEGYTRALNALAANKLSGRPRTSLRLGGVVFLFWTRQQAGADDVMTLEEPTPEQVATLIESADRGKETYAADPADFYCLALSANAARAIVRDYLEAPLPAIRVNLGRWFKDLRIIDDSYTGHNEPNSCFRLWSLATATVRDADDLSPNLPAVLTSAALKGDPLPDYVLAACLHRLRVESGGQQFRPARMGLIKLILNRHATQGELRMTEKLDPEATRRSPGYACGQLLAALARCQSPIDFGAGAQILERYFGSASTAPRAVFPILLRLNRHHLRKIRDENTGQAINLEKELEERLAAFHAAAGADPDFPAMLSLIEQGRFALGFYHQRAEYRRLSAERKAREEPAT